MQESGSQVLGWGLHGDTFSVERVDTDTTISTPNQESNIIRILFFFMLFPFQLDAQGLEFA
jgi:hypothetical protein